MHVHPEFTWELDITPEEEELLQNMRKDNKIFNQAGNQK